MSELKKDFFVSCVGDEDDWDQFDAVVLGPYFNRAIHGASLRKYEGTLINIWNWKIDRSDDSRFTYLEL